MYRPFGFGFSSPASELILMSRSEANEAGKKASEFRLMQPLLKTLLSRPTPEHEENLLTDSDPARCLLSCHLRRTTR
jgi:hypothetical protein